MVLTPGSNVSTVLPIFLQNDLYGYHLMQNLKQIMIQKIPSNFLMFLKFFKKSESTDRWNKIRLIAHIIPLNNDYFSEQIEYK